LAPTVGKMDLADVTYCRIRNTLELIHVAISENLIPSLPSNAKLVSKPFEAPFDPAGDFGDFQLGNELTEENTDFEEAGQAETQGREIVRG